MRLEFTKARNLNPLKIVICGPPASGKSYLAERLGVLYNLPHYKITDIVKYGEGLVNIKLILD